MPQQQGARTFEENDLLTIVQDQTEKILEAYSNILKNSSIVDNIQSSRSRLEVDVNVQALVRSVESLISLVQDLKLATVLHDYPARNAEVQEQQEMYTASLAKLEHAQAEVQRDLKHTLTVIAQAQSGEIVD